MATFQLQPVLIQPMAEGLMRFMLNIVEPHHKSKQKMGLGFLNFEFWVLGFGVKTSCWPQNEQILSGFVGRGADETLPWLRALSCAGVIV
jgi:hypothetical protein